MWVTPLIKAQFPLTFNDEESTIVDSEVQKLLTKGVVVHCEHVLGEVVSNVFLRPKKNGEYRMVFSPD